tara:strand:+ start:305 stop:511 length:207 start_codon:yes stop_codon:yes gene_type:complete
MVVLWLLLSWSHRDRPHRTEGEKEARSGITNAWEAKFARTGEVLRIDQFDGFHHMGLESKRFEQLLRS